MALDLSNNCDDEPAKLLLLIADDDPPTRMLLSATAKKAAYEIIETDNGDDAWRIIQTQPQPQILILDWLMPKINGIDLCSKIRNQLSKDYNPYIILLTQMTGTENVITGLEAGANEFLSKPFNIGELQSRLAVGDKIIRYEAMLKQKNNKLNDYIEKIEAAHTQALHASDTLVNIMKANNPAAISQEYSQHMADLQEVDTTVKDILDIFKSFKPGKN
jgi:DNA-binding response OmpR family regulator